jgi:hypothetical protein
MFDTTPVGPAFFDEAPQRATVVRTFAAPAARLFATKLDQKKEAKEIITEMLSKDRIKDTPEATEARILSTKI